MKTFRTTIQPEISKNKITYHTSLLFMGSCFTENIGNKMQALKFPVMINPFGVLYNPASVRKGLEILIDQKVFTPGDLGFFNEQWFSFYHDTQFSHPDREKCLDKINASIKLAASHLRKSKYLIITFGTAWIYKYLRTEKIVSNCHKIPSKEFERVKLGVEDIFVEWAKFINRLNELNRNLKIIFTVSPVRHWKDGAVQNHLSKSTLILAIYQLIKIFKNVEYFPSYEIMMDDLRDYRFYADDMLHPSNEAIEYIWDQFAETYFNEDTKGVIQDIYKIVLAKNHRPLNPETEQHKKFLKAQIKQITKLSKEYPFVDLSEELIFFKKGL
ncbi:MAG TPA: GSCFA domain-containing protein [Bacteroidales bacterium]|nr:GSCFA domain-containing protein [Bacteroidales bacterium]